MKELIFILAPTLLEQVSKLKDKAEISHVHVSKKRKKEGIDLGRFLFGPLQVPGINDRPNFNSIRKNYGELKK